MTYYVNYDPLQDQIIDYTGEFSLYVSLYFVHIEIDKVYHNEVHQWKNNRCIGENSDGTIKESWYTIPLQEVQNQLKELIREDKLKQLLS